MGKLAMIIMQAIAPTTLQPSPSVITVKLTDASKLCPSNYGGDIVICGRRDPAERYRLRPLDTDRFEPNRRAEAAITGDLKGSAAVESKQIGPGLTSNRIMLKLKLPF